MSSLWAHADRRGLSTAFTAGMARALPTTPTADPLGFTTGAQSTRVRDLRALLMFSAAAVYASADAERVVPVSKFPALPPTWKDLASPVGEAAAAVMTAPIDLSKVDPSQVAALKAINLAWFALATRNAKQTGRAIDLPYVYGFATENEGAPNALGGPLTEAGALPLLAIVGIVSGAAALAYLGCYALDVVERNLAREQDSRRLIALTSSATQLAAAHADKDRAANTHTPLSPAEQQVIDALISATKTYTATPSAPPAPGPKPILGGGGGGLFEGAGTAVALLAVIGLLLATRK